jgi:hypothetical protein
VTLQRDQVLGVCDQVPQESRKNLMVSIAQATEPKMKLIFKDDGTAATTYERVHLFDVVEEGTCHFFKPLVSKLLKLPSWFQYLDGGFNNSPQRY